MNKKPDSFFARGLDFKPQNAWRRWQIDRRATPLQNIQQEKCRRAGSTEAIVGDAIESALGVITRIDTHPDVDGTWTWERGVYTGDPRIDAGLPEDYIDYLKECAAEDGVYDEVEWEHEPCRYVSKVVPEAATDVYVMQAKDDLAQEFLEKRILGEWWPLYRRNEHVVEAYPILADPSYAMSARAFALDDDPWMPNGKQKTTTHRVTLPTARTHDGRTLGGKSIFAISTALTQQGVGGTVILDEYAIYSVKQVEIYEGVSKITALGGRLIISSRHNGQSNEFNRLLEKHRDDPEWHCPFINIYTAILQGARMADGQRRGWLIDPRKLTRSSDADYREQYLCKPRIGGQCAFSPSALAVSRSQVRKPLAVMKWDGEEWKPADIHSVASKEWHLAIWKFPEELQHYVIGADVASGQTMKESKENYTAFVVGDAATGDWCARAHGRVSPENAARSIAALHRMFNGAYVCPENDKNGWGNIMIRELAGLSGRPPLMPVHRIHNTQVYDGASDRFGVVVTTKERASSYNALVTHMEEAVPSGRAAMPDALAYQEMTTFSWNETKQRYDGTPTDDILRAASLMLFGVEVYRKSAWRTRDLPASIPPPLMPWERKTAQASGIIDSGMTMEEVMGAGVAF